MFATAESQSSSAVCSLSELIAADTNPILSFSPSVGFPAVGEHAFGFELVGELGAGTFGRVYLARQPAIGNRFVALKVSSDIVGECQALAQLRHTNIVPIYSVHEDAVHPAWKALCMPYFGGATLQSVVGELQSTGSRHTGSAVAASWRKLKTTVRNHVDETLVERRIERLPKKDSERNDGRKQRVARALTTFERIESESFVDAVLEIAAALADGLAHAHDHGILHRDLKPANVIITDDGEPMLVDFNLSEDVKQRRESLWSMAGGTLPYMSPEQIDEYLRKDGDVDQRSDLYSLGVIVFELLTGRLPFAMTKRRGDVWEEARADRDRAPPSARKLNRAVPRRVDVVIGKCLDADPAQRYQTARQLYEDVKRCLAGRPLVHARDPHLHERIGQWAERQAPRIFAAGVLVFAAFAGFTAHSLGEYEARRDAATAWTAARPQLDKHRFELAEAVIDRGSFAAVRANALQELAAFDDGLDFADHARFQRLGEAERQELRRRRLELGVLLAGSYLVEASASNGDERTQALADAERWIARVERLAGDGAAPKTMALFKAMILEAAGDAQAEASRKVADQTNPAGPGDVVLTALVHAMNREFETAREKLDGDLPQSSDRVFHAFVQGFCLREAGAPQQAIDLWESCARERPTMPQFRRAIGFTYYRFFTKSKPMAALRNLDAAIALQCTDLEALLTRAVIYKSQRKFSDALMDARDASRLGLSPFYAWSALKRLARGIENRSADEDALIAEADKKLAELKPEAFEDWLEVGKYGDGAKVRLAGFERALELRPWSLEANAGLLEQLTATGEVSDRAVQAVERARRMGPDLWKMHGLCGRVLAVQGQSNAALAEAKEALSKDVSIKQRLKAATNVYVQLLQKNPNDADRVAAAFSNVMQERGLTTSAWHEALAGTELAKSAEVAALAQRLVGADAR